jgi:hypothetical protein
MLMNAPLRTPAPVGSVEELRQYAADCLRLARIFASHAEELAEIGMDEELAATTRKLVAAVKAAAATVIDLRGRQ